MSSRPTPGPAAAEESPTGADEVVDQFRMLFEAVRDEARNAAKKAPIGGAQAWALKVIATNDRIGVNGLASIMGIHQSTASNLLRLLTEQGLVATTRAAGDRRVLELALTAKGRRWLARTPSAFDGVLAQSVAELDGTTLRRLSRDLGRLLEGVRRNSDTSPDED